MKKLVNTETQKSVDEHIQQLNHTRRQEESQILIDMMKDITGHEPKIWGTSIIAFGKYKYQRKNGDEFEWFNLGFSPGKTRLSLYVMYDINSVPELLSKLGKHKTGKGCLYINKLQDIDLSVLREILSRSDQWDRS